MGKSWARKWQRIFQKYWKQVKVKIPGQVWALSPNSPTPSSDPSPQGGDQRPLLADWETEAESHSRNMLEELLMVGSPHTSHLGPETQVQELMFRAVVVARSWARLAGVQKERIVDA